jgi:hypothetical protein
MGSKGLLPFPIISKTMHVDQLQADNVIMRSAVRINQKQYKNIFLQISGTLKIKKPVSTLIYS